MSYYTDWFLAEEADAEVIASSDDPLDRWPHLSMKGIGMMELTSLWSALDGKDPDGERTTSGTLLYQESEDGPFVSRVVPEFIQALAEVKDADRDRIAAEWQESDELMDWLVSEVTEIPGEIVEFARTSVRERKPVLELSAL